jgi:hypothetical protein
LSEILHDVAPKEKRPARSRAFCVERKE